MKLAKAAEIIKRDSIRAYIKRVNWRFMDERIQMEFERLKSDSENTSVLGDIYISRGKDENPIQYLKLISSQYINSTHVFTGTRFLGLNVINSESQSLDVAIERNAQLWYSQGPSGDVLVFIGPYQSNAGKIKESEIIIGKYRNPYLVTNKQVKKHFSIFFKYCTCTAQHSSSNMHTYLYRQYLIFNDFRYKSTYRNKFVRNVERFLILLIGGAAVWASLYAGGKL
ncbi:hypothetical protein ACUBZM_000288 [Enterobacter kobei]|uniref:hypothetical protein n=1 Tax=Enterobacter kobei TaxID=208224 RepID=UPI0011ECFD3C|nr:hypothetical protein [Enterobacter kobei]KAA0523248.1 hypothetical protein F0324_16675 [Enterobacter kobei]